MNKSESQSNLLFRITVVLKIHVKKQFPLYLHRYSQVLGNNLLTLLRKAHINGIISQIASPPV